MKKMILVLSILLISGCSSEYNLYIDNDYFSENLSLVFPKELITDDLVNLQTSVPLNVYDDKDEKYEMSDNSDSENYYINYSFKHKINDYDKSNFVVKCFSQSKVSQNDNIIKFETSEGFNCINMDDDSYMDEVLFNITTNLKVLSNNADVVNGNKYTWIFDQSDYKNKSINIELEKDNSILGKDINVIYIFICLFVLIIIGFGGFITIKNKNIKSNEL